MNAFLNRALMIIRSQTGAELLECKVAFDRTHSIQEAIQYIRKSRWRENL